MSSVPCPGCRAPLEPDQEVCPACRRPRDSHEIELGKTALEREEAERRARPVKVVRSLLVVAVLVGLYLERAPLRERAEGLIGGFRAEVEKVQVAGISVPPPSVVVTSPVVAASPVVVASPVAAPAPAAASVAPPPFEAVPATEPGPPANNMKRAYGVVYDLTTLRPVRGARVVFRSVKASEGAAAITDDAGHYAADLYVDALDAGMFVLVSAEGYRTGQLVDPAVPYREHPRESRVRMARETTDFDLEEAVVRAPGDKATFVLDFAVLAKSP